IATPRCGRRVPRLPRAAGPSVPGGRRVEGRRREPPEHYRKGGEEPRDDRGQPVCPRRGKRGGDRPRNRAAQRHRESPCGRGGGDRLTAISGPGRRGRVRGGLELRTASATPPTGSS